MNVPCVVRIGEYIVNFDESFCDRVARLSLTILRRVECGENCEREA